MVDHQCPGCDEEFVAVWQVAIGEEGGYTPVFGGPVLLHYGRCDACHAEYERTDDEPWRREEPASTQGAVPGRSDKTHDMNPIQRLLFGSVGAGAIVLAVARYRLAPRSAEEAARVGMIPNLFRSVATYRLAAVLTGLVGGAFIVLAAFAR